MIRVLKILVLLSLFVLNSRLSVYLGKQKALAEYKSGIHRVAIHKSEDTPPTFRVIVVTGQGDSVCARVYDYFTVTRNTRHLPRDYSLTVPPDKVAVLNEQLAREDSGVTFDMHQMPDGRQFFRVWRVWHGGFNREVLYYEASTKVITPRYQGACYEFGDVSAMVGVYMRRNNRIWAIILVSYLAYRLYRRRNTP